MQIKVVYDSRTGNTKKVADAIYMALPSSCEKDILDVHDYDSRVDGNGDLYFVGYWVRRGSASVEILQLLSSLHGKKAALFGTCGLMPVGEKGGDCLSETVRVWLPEDSVYLGSFLCRGRMDISVRNYCAQKKGSALDDGQVDAFLSAFDEAMLHPDRADLAAASEFARKIVDKALGRSPLTA